MPRIRPAAVAGAFYPEEPARLRRIVEECLAGAAPHPEVRVAKALIAPHAGYVYSGPVAGSAYAELATRSRAIRRVVLLGPAHRVAFRGLAVPGVDAFATPLGAVPIDAEAREQALALPQVLVSDRAHASEHSLEVQLPFLQYLLGDFALLPLVVGEASAEEVAEVIETLWGGEETLIVVSSDLSHYHDYESAQRLDRASSRAIAQLDAAALDSEQACGHRPIEGLLLAARRHGLRCTTLDLRNSGDTAGPRDRVVGYGAYAFH